MGFIADHQIPTTIGRLQLLLDIFITRKFIKPSDHQIGFEKPVTGTSRFQFIIGENLKRQLKAPIELILPLLGQTAGTDYQATFQVAAGNQFLDKQAGHNSFSGTGIVGQQKAQGLARQQGFVNRGNLVWERINNRSMNCKDRIEEVGQTDAVGLRSQTKKAAITIKTPRPTTLNYFQLWFIMTIEQLVGNLTSRGLISQLQGFGTEPLNTNNRNG